MKKVLLLMLVLVGCSNVSAQKIVAISLEWMDENIEKCSSLQPYAFYYSPKIMSRVVIIYKEDINVIMNDLANLEKMSKYPALDTRGRLLVFYENDFVDCAYFGYLQINYNFKAFHFSPSFILTLNKIVKKYNKRGFWPSRCAYYLRRQAMDKKGS